MALLSLLEVADSDAWLGILRRTGDYDSYHLPQYHALAERHGEGKARLFVYEAGGYTIALPLLFRDVGNLPGLEGQGGGLYDATSVYGYAGPVASHRSLPPTVCHEFQRALGETLRDERVVAAFSRLHPLIAANTALDGLGEIAAVGSTVSLDLTLTEPEQLAQYRTNHLRDIRKLQRQGVICYHDANADGLDDFVRIYYETMRRVGATPGYFFPFDYFEDLLAGLAPHAHLFLCHAAGELVCGGLFTICGDYVQYHLGGTSDRYAQHAPMKLLLDTVRHWAVERGARVFHLGGGVGAREDPLFRFKAGFSNCTHTFRTWQYVVQPDCYAALVAEKARWNHQNGLEMCATTYFPAYRAPTIAAPRVATFA